MINYTGPARGLFAGVLANASTTIRTDAITVRGNTFTGPLLAAVRVSGSYAGTGSVATADNTATGATQGLRCENVATGSSVKGPICAARNTWPANACGPAGFVTECP